MTVGAEQVISVMLLHSFSHMEKECGESERQVVALQADVKRRRTKLHATLFNRAA